MGIIKYLTIEDLETIRKYVTQKGIKDSQFEEQNILRGE